MPLKFLLVFCISLVSQAGDFHTPAGIETAARRPGAQSVLPGGRFISPLGQTQLTGPGPFGIAVNAKADTVVSADGGPGRFSLTVLKRDNQFWLPRTLIVKTEE